MSKIIIAALLLSAPISALANNTVCSGPLVYYKTIQADSGIRRMPEFRTVFANLPSGKVLTYTENGDAMPKYDIALEPVRELVNEHNGARSFEVYTAKITISKNGKKVVTDEVTCTHTIAFLP